MDFWSYEYMLVEGYSKQSCTRHIPNEYTPDFYDLHMPSLPINLSYYGAKYTPYVFSLDLIDFKLLDVGNKLESITFVIVRLFSVNPK